MRIDLLYLHDFLRLLKWMKCISTMLGVEKVATMIVDVDVVRVVIMTKNKILFLVLIIKRNHHQKGVLSMWQERPLCMLVLYSQTLGWALINPTIEEREKILEANFISKNHVDITQLDATDFSTPWRKDKPFDWWWFCSHERMINFFNYLSIG